MSAPMLGNGMAQGTMGPQPPQQRLPDLQQMIMVGALFLGSTLTLIIVTCSAQTSSGKILMNKSPQMSLKPS